MRSGAKWKVCASVEVVHTHGLRTDIEGTALLKQYARGVGGNYGRFTRRGDIISGIRFLLQQSRTVVRAVVRDLPQGRRPRNSGWVRDGLIGFWQGFMLSPNQGFVSAADLRLLRAQLAATADPSTAGMPTSSLNSQAERLRR